MIHGIGVDITYIPRFLPILRNAANAAAYRTNLQTAGIAGTNLHKTGTEVPNNSSHLACAGSQNAGTHIAGTGLAAAHNAHIVGADLGAAHLGSRIGYAHRTATGSGTWTRMGSYRGNYAQRFLRKVLHPSEVEYYHTLRHEEEQARYAASRWAVKEACVKASGVRLFFPDICVHKSKKSIPLTSVLENQSPRIHSNPQAQTTPSFTFNDPRPVIEMCGRNRDALSILGVDLDNIMMSLSHDGDYTTAMILMTKK